MLTLFVSSFTIACTVKFTEFQIRAKNLADEVTLPMLPKEFVFAVTQSVYVLMLIFFSMYNPPFGIKNQSIKDFYIKFYTKFMCIIGVISVAIFPIWDIVMNIWMTAFSHRNEIKKSVYADALE